MKIVCDACQAKYSISDDKVQGKVFKIRCKKCSNIIVVRGGAGAADPAPAPQQEKDTRVYDYGYEGGDHAPAGDESVWHVVINQDQVGPMTAVEVQRRFASGEIDSETYIWREGFADWLPLSQVDTFASLAASGASAAPASAPSREGVASMFGEEGTGRSVGGDPGDLFAAASGAGRHDDDGGDLFGGKPGTSPASNAGAKMRGERNENSVLFSLNNLAQLASDKPVASPVHAASASAPAASGGQSGGEGSGLIDIRSMASAYLGGPGGGPSKPVSAGIGSIDDLPVFGGSAFSEPAVIVPISSRGGNSNKLMYVLIGSVGVLAVAAAIVVVVLLKGGGDKEPPSMVAVVPAKVDSDKPAEPKEPSAAATETRPAEPVVVKPPEPRAPEPPPSEPKTTPPPPSRVAATEPPAEPKRPARPPSSTATTATRPTRTEKPAAPVKADPPPSKPAADSGGCDEVSCVLNNYEGACCAKYAKKGGGGGGGKSAPRSDLPESLDRAMISEGVAKVKAQVTSCGDRFPAKGQVKVSVKVGADGRVASVTVKESPDPGLGNCVAGQVQKATFAKTQSGGSFAYPYKF